MTKRRFRAQFDKRPVVGEFVPWEDPASESREGDGKDPCLDRPERKKVPNRKALQLCAQVRDALNLALNAWSGTKEGDEILRNLTVIMVAPNPDSTNLLVSVDRGNLPMDVSLFPVLEALTQAKGRLRTEIAQSITRKRVPSLQFQIV